jgi:hypothetical protein
VVIWLAPVPDWALVFCGGKLLAIDDAKKLTGAEVGENLSFPHEVVFSGEAYGDHK